MKVHNNFQAMVSCPCYGLLQVRQLARGEGLSGADLEGPVSDRDTDVVETCKGI